MAFSYTGGAANNGSSSTASVTHGQTINSGDLVIMYVNRNDATAISTPTGGTAFTEALQETPSGETARHALYWKIAGGSEPSSYSAGLTSSSAWQAHVRVYTSATDAEVDAAAASDTGTSGVSELVAGAADGAVISDDALSIICAGKDNTGSVNYTGADNSYVSALGSGSGRLTGSAHRIYTTGTTFSGDITFTDDASPGSDFTYSIHMSFVESAGGTFTLTADAGTYTITGAAAALEFGANVAADSGSYTYTGTSVDLNFGFNLAAASGSYTYSGTDVTLTFESPSNFTLTADTGTYTYSGTNAALEASFTISAGSGAYTYAGTNADLNRGFNLAAESGAYSYTGTNASLLLASVLSANAGGYVYNGTDVILDFSGQVWTIQADEVTTWTSQSDASTTWTIQNDSTTTWTIQ